MVDLVKKERIKLPRIGTRKLLHRLDDDFKKLKIGRDRLFSILKTNKLLVLPKRSYHITTDSKHHLKKHKDLVDGLEINQPEQVWVSDITYVGTRENPLYLSLVTDAYSKQIMGYDLSNTLATGGALRAFRMAVRNRKYKKRKLIHHSDRGVQYCSFAYQRALQKAKIRPSMTESYDPYKNAIAERVNGILKHEFLLEKYASRYDVLNAYLKECIQTYNLIRPHISCGMRTPVQMHQTSGITRATYKQKRPNKETLIEP